MDVVLGLVFNIYFELSNIHLRLLTLASFGLHKCSKARVVAEGFFKGLLVSAKVSKAVEIAHEAARRTIPQTLF